MVLADPAHRRIPAGSATAENPVANVSLRRPSLDGERVTGAPLAVSTRRWVFEYVRRLRISDALVIAAAVLLAQFVRFGFSWDRTAAVCFAISALMVAMWTASLSVFQARDRRIAGWGPEEYTRIVHSSVVLFGVISMIALTSKLDVARGYLAIALPAGVLGLIISRWGWRRHLRKMHAKGEARDRVLILGTPESINQMMGDVVSEVDSRYNVVGLCTPGHDARSPGELHVGTRTLPVFGGITDVPAAALATSADIIAVTSVGHFGPEMMRQLSWDLEGSDVDLVVSPGVTDVAGPRMLLRPVAGLPFVHIERPQYEGANRILKLLVDKVGAVLLLMLFGPVMVITAIAVKCTSRGPVFYRADRIGLNNEPFPMFKFRSMVVGADAMVDSLTGSSDGNGVLFKMREDPRVTSVGKVIRRFSLDELPQLLNVLRGEMSLVGPRPPLRAEVEKYDGIIARRMLVRPGMTGLWQVSGRSNLSWEESVRLDLSYVENWSMMQDLMILWRTLRAVVGSDGAY